MSGFSSVDGIIFQTYDVFVDGLDAIETDIQNGKIDAADTAK
jgi:hypothetical protein